MAMTLPLLYTHVMGSHGFPGWFWTACLTAVGLILLVYREG